VISLETGATLVTLPAGPGADGVAFARRPAP